MLCEFQEHFRCIRFENLYGKPSHTLAIISKKCMQIIPGQPDPNLQQNGRSRGRALLLIRRGQSTIRLCPSKIATNKGLLVLGAGHTQFKSLHDVLAILQIWVWGRVQTTWTKFWAILTPLCGHFY